MVFGLKYYGHQVCSIPKIVKKQKLKQTIKEKLLTWIFF